MLKKKVEYNLQYNEGKLSAGMYWEIYRRCHRKKGIDNWHLLNDIRDSLLTNIEVSVTFSFLLILSLLLRI